MANPIQIRPWSRLASLRSLPNQESHPKPQTAESSLKTSNTFSNDNNESATKSLPTSPDVHSPMQSQKLKLKAPEPQLETNESGSLVKESRETVQITKGIGQKNEKEGTTKENETKGKGIHKKVCGSGEHGIRVITISGENRGACMQITKSHNYKKPIHKMRGVYANGNVQCVNNSMVLHTSLTHHHPGLHLVIPFGEGFRNLKKLSSSK